ncbi:guanylate kinase [Balneola sp. MJW-20]|uniref:guanylate kinase n=1 Tax=Gracilimonas aurantiaca TaxID=3234185 RepID=UPI0034665731
MKKGKVIILVAPSGSGKSTMAKRLFKDFDNIKFSVSATTRPPREGEIHGKDYFFLSDDEFSKRIEEKDFLEWEEFYGGKRYGTLRSEVDKILNSGYFILLDVEVKGAVNVKEIYGDECLSIFIKPPSLQTLKERLIARGTEDKETLRLRLERAEEELTYADRFDRIVINDDLDTAYSEINKLVSDFMNNQ